MSVRIYQSKSQKIRTIEKEPVDLKILEKYSPETITFDTPEEFTEYLTEHKEEMDATTTNKLNKKYKIRNYSITKIKGEICLKKSKNTVESDDKLDQIIAVSQEVKQYLTAVSDKLDTFLSLFTKELHSGSSAFMIED